MVVITLTMIPRGFVSICGETIAFIAKRGEPEDVCVCCQGYITGDLRGDHQDTQLFFTDPEGRRWFRTGDYGMIDVAGFLYVQEGRVKDLVKRAGVSTTPAA